MRFKESSEMEIWKWDGGYGSGYAGWFSDKIGEVGEMIDNTLSVEMEKLSNLRGLWEKPYDTFKSVSDRFCDACSHVRLKMNVVEQRETVKRKLHDWVSSIEVAVISQYKLMERALNEEDMSLTGRNSPQPRSEAPNLHLASLGYVKQMPLASRSSILCDKLDTLEDVPRSVALRVCDYEGNACNLIDRHLELRAVLLYDDGEDGDVSVSRSKEIGEYTLCFRALRPGRATLSVKIHGADVAGSPRSITVYPTKDWSSGDIVPSFFGSEGDSRGKFQRPWGIGCDRQGRLLVADRSNNRVQVFEDDGGFVFEFGRKGTAAGEFNLVSGVAGAPNGDLVCVDKDNHRIQVFSELGCFKFAFGGFGEKPGEFHYPWDVDINARGEIIVTDSRNSRIQLFSPSGKFIKEFGRNDFAEFDSPRGVSFINSNEVVVSDFNAHNLVIVNLRTKKHRVICREGSGPGELKRPQGVAWHPQGFIVVGDSRNNRVQAVDRYGTMVWEIGQRDYPVECNLDRPCGVAVTKKGKLVSIDFGKNRVVTLQ